MPTPRVPAKLDFRWSHSLPQGTVGDSHSFKLIRDANPSLWPSLIPTPSTPLHRQTTVGEWGRLPAVPRALLARNSYLAIQPAKAQSWGVGGSGGE